MKSSSKPVVCTLVFFFSCIFTVSGQTEMKTRAEQPAVDATVKVHGPPGVRAPGIKGCLSQVSSYNVRVQSLKTSGGSVYTRQLVTTAYLPCLENSGTKATLIATTIANCAEATAKKGLNSFSWENGACTAYLAWRPQKRADCKDGGSKVVYFVKKPLTPIEGGKIIVSGKIRYDARPLVFLDISHKYDDLCGVSSRINKGYKLQINGSDVVMLPEGNVTYNLSRKRLCSGPMNISLWSVDAAGNVNSDESKVTDYGSSGSHYYGLQTGGCIYASELAEGYNPSLQYCNSINGSLYSAEVAGEAQAFLDAMAQIAFPASVNSFYVGLRLVAKGQWAWLDGLPLSVNDSVWRSNPALDVGVECAKVSPVNARWHFVVEKDCITIFEPVVCYFRHP